MILILNGPNLNLLGRREPDIYGHDTLKELETHCHSWAEHAGTRVTCRQSNHEGQLIDWVQDAHSEGFSALILNAGGLTHSSVALRDAVAGCGLPCLEVHLSNIYARESFRHHSFLSPVCVGTVAGLGFESYRAAIDYFARTQQTPSA